LAVRLSFDGKYITESYKPQLPKASIGKSCIRFKKLSDVDSKVLAALLKENHKAYKLYLQKSE
jgi:hypothetical protein